MKWQLNKKVDDEPLGRMRTLGPLIGSGSQLAITMVAFVLIGKYIDDKNSSSPVWTLTLALLGIVIGMYGFIKTIISLNKKNPPKK